MTDERFLHDLVTELGKLKKLKTVFESVDDLVRQTRAQFKPSDGNQLDTVGVTSRLLNFVAKSAVNLGDARGLLDGLDSNAATMRLLFANGLSNLHKEIHDEVFPSPQARLQQTTTLGLLLQELVAAEEAQYQTNAQPSGQSA